MRPAVRLQRLELTGQSEIPVDVWVDDDERVRRMHWEQVFREDDVFDATELAVQQLEQDAP